MLTPDKKAQNLNDEMAHQIHKEWEQLRSDRVNFDNQWEEIAQRIWPNFSTHFTSLGLMTAGEKRTQYVYDSSGARALNRFSAILDSLLTPRSSRWHRLEPDDDYLMKDRQTREWFEESTRILFKERYATSANYAQNNYHKNKCIGAFGNGALFTDELQMGKRGLRYKTLHLGELWFYENHQGMVDGFVRYYPYTARQAVQAFGEENLPRQIVEALKVEPERKFFFLHCVKPRKDRDPARADYRGYEYASYHVSVEGRKMLRESGYSSFPLSVSRYEQVPGETYGRGPASDALPAIKTLNEMAKTVLKQGHRSVDPVLLAHDDGVLDGFSLRPGAINPGGVSADGRALVHALPVGNIAIGKDLMDDQRVDVNGNFLVDLFQILVENPQMTATEVMERAKEKAQILAPSLGGLQGEPHGVQIDREVDLLVRQKVLPPLPRALIEARGKFKIVYDAPINRMQRAEEASGLMRTLEFAMNWALQTQNPAPLDHFDEDAIIPDLADIEGVPIKYRRTMEKIEEMREGRAQAAEEQAQNQAAPGAAALMKSTAALKVANSGK